MQSGMYTPDSRRFDIKDLEMEEISAISAALTLYIQYYELEGLVFLESAITKVEDAINQIPTEFEVFAPVPSMRADYEAGQEKS